MIPHKNIGVLHCSIFKTISEVSSRALDLKPNVIQFNGGNLIGTRIVWTKKKKSINIARRVDIPVKIGASDYTYRNNIRKCMVVKNIVVKNPFFPGIIFLVR